MKKLIMHTTDEAPTPCSKNIVFCENGYVGVAVLLSNPYKKWWSTEKGEVPYEGVLYWYSYEELYGRDSI